MGPRLQQSCFCECVFTLLRKRSTDFIRRVCDLNENVNWYLPFCTRQQIKKKQNQIWIKVSQHIYNVFLSSDFLLICYSFYVFLSQNWLNPSLKKGKVLILKIKKKKKETSFNRSHQIHGSEHKREESAGMDINNDTAALGCNVKTKWFHY